MVFHGPPAFGGDTYKGCGPAPTVSAIQYTCVATTPANQTRTTIGIGEAVTCSIKDYQATACDVTTKQANVNDPMGTATWTCTGSGNVEPATGASTTLTATMDPGKASVSVSVTDQFGVYAAVVKSQDFKVIAPSTESGAVKTNSPLDTAGPPNNQIGSETYFTITVGPATANFDNATLQEDIQPLKWTWPDGTNDDNSNVDGGNLTPNWNTSDNKTTDDCTEGEDPIGRLKTAQGAWQGITITYHLNENYQNGAGNFVQWYKTEDHKSVYRGATQDSQQIMSVDNQSSGSWQGPYR